ncbi:MAG: hypothetical protein ACRD2Y_02620 [Terriglobales bacterium]
MNTKRFFITWIVVFFVGFTLNFVIHGVLLHDDYSKLPNLLRTQQDAQNYFPFMIVANIVYSLALAWIYVGVAVWLMTAVPVYLTYYAVQPWPLEVIYKSIGFDLVRITLIGIVAAAIYRK